MGELRLLKLQEKEMGVIIGVSVVSIAEKNLFQLEQILQAENF